jgi:hypothetical protein
MNEPLTRYRRDSDGEVVHRFPSATALARFLFERGGGADETTCLGASRIAGRHIDAAEVWTELQRLRADAREYKPK